MKSTIYAVIGGSLIGLLFGLVFILYFYDMDTKSLIVARMVFSIFVVGSIIIAAMQFRLNRKQSTYANRWNKKQLAITRLHESRKLLKDLQKKLHGHIEILEHDEDNPFRLYEIHDSFGVKLINGDFVFHGEQTQEDMRLVPEKQPDQDVFRAIEFKDDVNGREVKDHILDFIGEYEYICSAVNSDVFDDDVVKRLYKKNIVRIYKIFEPYIRHLQITHEYGRTVFCEFEEVAERYASDKA